MIVDGKAAAGLREAVHRHVPRLSDSRLEPALSVTVLDHTATRSTRLAAAESPLTVRVDGAEIVQLMTLGTAPERLVLGYLLNQRLIHRLEEILSVTVDWQDASAEVVTVAGMGVDALTREDRRRIVTTGCGQGTVYSCTLDRLYERQLPALPVARSALYAALVAVRSSNAVYRSAGSVHGCALVGDGRLLCFNEDVGRHNAMDAVAGTMWLDGIEGAGRILYCTGRLTSEIVMKAVMMRVPTLVSRNGVSRMAVELAEDLGVLLVARAKGRHFQVFSRHDSLVYDSTADARG